MKSSVLILLAVTFGFFSTCGSLAKNQYGNEVTAYQMTWKGYERSYLVHLPPPEKWQAPLPILFHLHGGGGTAKGNLNLTFNRFNELADRDGFMVVYPNAVEKNWNDGRTSDSVKSWKEDIDDVGFIAAIIDELKAQYNVDENRIFTTGMSNGGFMSARLLCDRADLFRGGAILTASLSRDFLPKCNPSKALAVIVMNGTDDPLVPYDGGPVKVFNRTRGEIISTDEWIQFWKDKNECTTKLASQQLADKVADDTRVEVEEYANCKEGGALILYRIKGGGHTWPGGKQYLGERIIGKTSRDIVACDVIWAYFKSL